MQEAYKTGRSRRVDDEATVGTEIRAADENHGLRVRGAPPGARRVLWRETGELAAARRNQPERDVLFESPYRCEQTWSAIDSPSSESS